VQFIRNVKFKPTDVYFAIDDEEELKT